MPYCCVVGCKSGTKRPGIIQYQQFPLPETKGMRNQWLEKINRDFIPNANTRICAKHFHFHDFIPDKANVTSRGKLKKKRKLKLTAIPSLYLNGTVI